MLMRSGCFLSICLVVFSLAANAQLISGTVHDELGGTVEGATVQAKGTPTIVAADNLGAFSINIGPAVKNLIVSAVGFETLEVPATDGINIQLKRNQAPLTAWCSSPPKKEQGAERV